MVFRVILLILLFASISHGEGLTLERAVESTLKLQADIIYSKLSADSSGRAVEGSRGPFDHVLSSGLEVASVQTPLDDIEKNAYQRDRITTKPQTYSMKLTKLTRSGIGFETSATVLNSNDLSPTLTQPREATTTIGVAINFPIFDLLMENVNTTNEKIALENNKAVIDSYFFQASTSVYQTVVSYWGYLAAYERLRIYKESERDTRKMLADFEQLVANGERPRADANQIKASLASKQGQIASGEKDLFSTGCELAKSMGVLYDGTTLPPPKGPWVDARETATASADALIRDALEKRFDIKALESVIRSSELAMESSRRSLRPELNVYVSADYSDKGPNITGDVVDNAKTLKAGVIFSTPLGNSSAKSDLAQKGIVVRQKALNLANAKRKASLDVASSVNELNQNLKAYKYSLETVRLYHESLLVEEEKMKLGMSTVIDVINIRENYQNAKIVEIDNLCQVAVSLAGILYGTGDIIAVQGDRISVNLSALYSLKQSFAACVPK